MKRMSDVFKLPVHASEFSESMPYEYLDDEEKEMCEHEARAINHVDALADALEYVLSLPRGTSGRVIIEKHEEEKLITALKAYRGEK